MIATLGASAQVARSTASEVKMSQGERTTPRVRGEEDKSMPVVSSALSSAPSSTTSWKRIVYKELDLDKDANATLYYPEDVLEGSENLFRIILNHVAGGDIPAYEYLDGREIFTPEFMVNTAEVLDKFYIPYTEGRGSTQQRPRYVVDPIDVPTTEVLSYYIIEDWAFDNVANRSKASVEAVCPVIHRAGDFGEATLKYPMFWVAMEHLEPYLKNTAVFVDEFDVSPRYSLNDYFAMNLYDGEIYKTRNLRNKSLQQLFPDDDSRQQAADSIQKSLKNFDKALWVPSREEVLEARRALEEKEEKLGEIPQKQAVPQSPRRSTRSSRGKPKASSATTGNVRSGAVTRSVRDKK